MGTKADRVAGAARPVNASYGKDHLFCHSDPGNNSGGGFALPNSDLMEATGIFWDRIVKRVSRHGWFTCIRHAGRHLHSRLLGRVQSKTSRPGIDA